MNEKKKILIVISTLTGGGAERAVSNITLNIPENISVDLLLNSTSENNYPSNANIITLNMRAEVKKTLFYQFRVLVKRLFKLHKLKKEGNYDGCYSFLESANFANILTGKRYAKTIVSVRNNLSQDKNLLYRCVIIPFAKLLYAHADHVIALSKGVEHDLIKNFKLSPELVKTIYNGYDVERINKIGDSHIDDSIQKFIDGSDFCFISTGRHVQQKGHWHLIRVFSELVKAHPKAKLILLGQGTLTKMLNELIDNYNLSNNVLLAGFVSNPYSIMKRVDAFVFPSLFEGFGNVAVEALACGLPVISTDFRSGAREILTLGDNIEKSILDKIEIVEYGVLCPVCSGNKLTFTDPLEEEEKYLLHALEKIIVDKELYKNLKEKCKLRASDFDIKSTVSEWIELL